jgi:potassium/hydrogen antiporter
LANAFGLAGEPRPLVPHTLELISIGKTNNEMMEVHVKEGAAILGKPLKDVKLPKDTLITAVVRSEKLITPRGDTRLAPGDILYVLVSKKEREKVKRFIMQKPESHIENLQGKE